MCFAFDTIFLLLFGIFSCVFDLNLKSIRYVCRKLIVKFVDDESGLHHGYLVVNCNLLNLFLVGNNLVRFFEHLQ